MADFARSNASSPCPSLIRLWSTVYPTGTCCRELPTSGHEKFSFCCADMNALIKSSEGFDQHNICVSLLRAEIISAQGNLRRQLERSETLESHGLLASCSERLRPCLLRGRGEAYRRILKGA